jgi:hypothetical protein
MRPRFRTEREDWVQRVVADGHAIHILTAAISFNSPTRTWRSHGIESKLLKPLSVNVKKGATGRQRT